MSRYVVCGATGFMGRNIAERFGRLFPGKVVGIYHKRPVVDIPGVSWQYTDLLDAAQVDKLIEAGDIVVQAAAISTGALDAIERPHIFITDNVIMNSLLLRACYEKKASQFVYTSCPVMYPSNLNRALKEEDFSGDIDIDSPYYGGGWMKVYTEKMCMFYSKFNRTRHTAFRHTNCYGPYDKFDSDHSHMYCATISKVMHANDYDTISVWGPGTEGRDLLYVDDVVDFVVAALNQKTPFELVNLGCGRAYPVNEVVDTIIKVSGKCLTVQHDLSKPHIPSNIWLDTSKAERLFGWKPKTSLIEGTQKTIEWYRKNYV
jgi:nucleoside-diphosphate-sugar epimerase